MRDRRGDFSFLPATRTLDYSKGQLESRLLAKEIVPCALSCLEKGTRYSPLLPLATPEGREWPRLCWLWNFQQMGEVIEMLAAFVEFN
jgi:hypothetical protein